jgi:hypothetical protein
MSKEAAALPGGAYIELKEKSTDVKEGENCRRHLDAAVVFLSIDG